MAEHAQARRAAAAAVHGNRGAFAGPQASPLSESAAVQRLAALSERINRPSPVAVQRMPGSDGGGGLPRGLRSGIESLSGLSMAGVRVHRNSDRPAQLQALAYTQGTDIHLAPGQDRHLPHEAWHVVQQMQGRVAATRQLQAGVPLNDDTGLEREADVMGSRAADYSTTTALPAQAPVQAVAAGTAVVQRFGDIRFANVSNTQKYRDKADAIIRGLRSTDIVRQYLANKNVLITLEETDHYATIDMVGDQIQIKLAPWFFEQQSRGRILGMLAHEFGVHPLATEMMTGQERAQENLDFDANTEFQTGLPGRSIWPKGRNGQDNDIQRDHIFVALANQPRFRIYRQTVHQMATSLLERAQQRSEAGTTLAHVTDLIMTYLSDIAMILATNDHRRDIATSPSLIALTAAAFNQERNRWIASLLDTPADAELRRLTPPEKDGLAVAGEGLSLIGRKWISFLTSSTSDSGYAHDTQANVLATTNRVQAALLADHGLAVVGNNNGPFTLFDAINTVSGFPDSRDRFLRWAGANNPDQDIAQTVQWVNANQNLTAEINQMQLWAISQVLGFNIRILQPSGKMMEGGGPGRRTIVWVRQPSPRYRPAQ